MDPSQHREISDMCNIAGYIGSSQAAPVLIDIMRKEQGFYGGYFSGIATVHEGKIHYAKVMGDLDELLRRTDAASLPGAVGIIHSRTNSGGEDSWAHPFVGIKDGEVRTAYVANGILGEFSPRGADMAAVAEGLIRDGYELQLMEKTEKDFYLTLSDGRVAHVSDVMCQMMLKNVISGMPAAEAIADTFCRCPLEAVGLLLCADCEDSISFAKINMPMSVSHAPHGMYLASTAMAMPDDAGTPYQIPAGSYGSVSVSGISVSPLPDPPAIVAGIDAGITRKAFDIITARLREQPLMFKEIAHTFDEVFEEEGCLPREVLTYDILYALNRQGRLVKDLQYLPGAAPGLVAPKFFMSLKD